MLTSLLADTGTKVHASEVSRGDGPFVCPKCGCATVVHKGTVKVHHFAHKPPIRCQYGTGESEAHRQAKTQIYEAIRSRNSVTCELEKDLGPVVPDIWIDFGAGKPKLALEVQISTLPMQRIIERTQAYARLGVYVLWLTLYREEVEQERFRPKQWEKWLHAAYYGRVYYWRQELELLPIHYRPHQLWSGGYYRASKRYRDPVRGQPVQLHRDFRVYIRTPFVSPTLTVPACRIVVDKQPAWW